MDNCVHLDQNQYNTSEGQYIPGDQVVPTQLHWDLDVSFLEESQLDGGCDDENEGSHPFSLTVLDNHHDVGLKVPNYFLSTWVDCLQLFIPSMIFFYQMV